MAIWLSKTTPDGRWQYGYGEYNKSVADLASMGGIYVAAQAYLESYFPSIKSVTKVPTYYIWAIDVNGYKKLGGHWNLLTGGKAAMLAYFNNFASAFAANQNDMSRDALLQQTRDHVSIQPVASSAPETVPNSSDGVDPGGGSSGFVVPLAIAAVLLVLVLR